MDNQHLAAAIYRSKLAEQSLHQLAVNLSRSDFEMIWDRFVTDLNRGMNQLLVAAKELRLNDIYKTLSDLRKNDPLLAYMRLSRHAFEHSSEPPVGTTPSWLPVQSETEYLSIGLALKTGEVVGGGWPGNDAPQRHKGWYSTQEIISLKTVFENNRRFDPPESHLGSQINDTSPQAIAEISLIFFKSEIEKVCRIIDELGSL